jgi:nitrite reductase/ring-hydroxylating ferredoxin subunit
MAEPIRIEGVTPPGEGQGVRVLAGGTPVALFRVGGQLYAIDARCTHVGGPLDQGRVVDGPAVRCPWHGSVFSLASGGVTSGPATRPVRAYRARFEGDTLVLDPTG